MEDGLVTTVVLDPAGCILISGLGEDIEDDGLEKKKTII